MLESSMIEIKKGALQYLDSDTPIMQNLNMQIPAHRWTCILGKSGCGKSSLLRYLAGLLDNTVAWGGNVSFRQGEQPNQIAYMAQQDLLMPWLNVLDNVCFSLKFSQQKRTETQTKNALALIESVGLSEHTQKQPHQLSGGMRQRVALARTLMQDKPIVLMDEPFSALDAITRHKLQNLSAKLLRDRTVILITHDPQEALRLGSQIYIMQGNPAYAAPLEVPQSTIPRVMDNHLAQLHQSILQTLERDYA